MITTKQVDLPYTYVDTGLDMTFTEFNVPGVIATQLALSDLSHIETLDHSVNIVINEAGKQRRISFTNDSFACFQLVLRDRQLLDVDVLDEHIVLEEVDRKMF